MLSIMHGVFLFRIRKDPFHRLLALGILVHYLFCFAQQVVFGHYASKSVMTTSLRPPLFHCSIFTPPPFSLFYHIRCASGYVL